MLRTVFGKNYITQAVTVRLFGSSSLPRAESTKKLTYDEVVQSYKEDKKELEEELKKEFPKPYDGPERDLVNFPRRPRAVEPDKVRMAFLPEEWFQFFYKKTGVTGPYVFGAGLLAFLLSKEWYVIEEELSTGISIFILAYIGIKKFGAAARAYRDNLVEEEEKRFEDAREKNIENLVNATADRKKMFWQAGCERILMEAKRENVMMQLETEYRRRLMTVYEQTKRRLDYNLELYNTTRKLEQKHMVDWIVNSVIKSITPEQEKEALKKCIEDLNALSLKA